MTTTAEVIEVPGTESNTTFARRVGCDHTMASRLRSGQRMPSGKMLNKICNAYGLDHGEALQRFGEGREVFSKWLRDKVFDVPHNLG